MKLLFFPYGYEESAVKEFSEQNNIKVNRLRCEKGYVQDLIKIECSGYTVHATDIPTFLREHCWWKNTVWDIYFYVDGEFKSVQTLTDKWLREAHNIENLFLNGGLDENY